MIAFGKYYVSVTGLQTKSWLSFPRMVYLSSRAYNASVKAEGNVYSSMFAKDGVHHTITAWESREAMRRYFNDEDHVAAMRSMKDVASYVKVHGYFTDELPSAEEAIGRWRKEGRRVYGQPNAKCGDRRVSVGPSIIGNKKVADEKTRTSRHRQRHRKMFRHRH